MSRENLTKCMVQCSLLCRTFDSGLAEVCHEEGVGLLAYSPLAMGLLTVSLHYNPYQILTCCDSYVYYRNMSRFLRPTFGHDASGACPAPCTWCLHGCTTTGLSAL